MEGASWPPLGFDRAERPREVRYLPVVSEALADDGALLAFSVHCPRYGTTGVEDCMECSHSGKLRYHGRGGPLVLECTLARLWRAGPR